jgi:hypothetical protein
MSQALEDIAEERKRQIGRGFTSEHDDAYQAHELPRAAAAYAVPQKNPIEPPFDDLWPFDLSWWKLTDSRRLALVKAGALIVAEIERLDRANPARTA